MKKLIPASVVAIALSGTAVLAYAEDSSYIPWTFDDFNSNCEVKETNDAYVFSSAKVVIETDTLQAEVVSEAAGPGW